jgi:prevent-host-death family protein
MGRTIGAFEAKTHLSGLLDEVAKGEEITITKHGRPVAKLVPVDRRDSARIDAAIAHIRDLRKGCRLDGIDWKDLRDEGKR